MLLKGRETGQGMVEFALIATGAQVRTLYSDIVTTMCNYHAGC